MKEYLLSFLLFFVIIIANNANLAAQNLPAISYAKPLLFRVDSAITPVSPINRGGAVFPANYGEPTTFANYITPFSIATDGSNNVYTTNNSTGDLTKYNAAGTALFTISTGYVHASEIAVDKLGNIYVSQFAMNSVLKYSAAGSLLASIPGFSDPYGIAFDALNNAYVANYHSGNILKIDAGTTNVSVYLTAFDKPYGISIDDDGNMYVGEQERGDVIKVAAGTLARTTFASGLNSPRHLNKDAFGNIYVADYGNNTIDRISPIGKITIILHSGLSAPRQAAFDASGNLYIANYGSDALLKSAATAYSISGPLPDGLKFDATTGQITGTPTTPGKTTATVSAYNTWGTDTTALTIVVEPPEEPPAPSLAGNSVLNNANGKIKVHPALSPNGDGINDFLLIEGIENYPDNKVTILNVSGAPIFAITGYNNADKVFNGHSNVDGKLQQPGTYYYVVEYNENGKAVRKTGFIVLKLK